jgi:DNA ligase-1
MEETMDNQVALLYEFSTTLKSLSKKKEKYDFIAGHDTPLITAFLNFVLSNSVVTGLSKSKISKKIDNCVLVNFDVFDVMRYLMSNNTGKDDDIAVVQSFINQNLAYADFLVSVFTKTLTLGVEAKTVNQALGREVVRVWEVQQGKAIDHVKLKPDELIGISQKLNGVRGTLYNGAFFSRNGSTYTGLDHIVKDVERLFGRNWYESVVLDGELVRKNTDGLSDSENFQIGTGIINSDSQDKSSIEYVIFEVLTRDDFESEEGRYYSERVEHLNKVEEAIAYLGLENVRIVPRFYLGTDHSQIGVWLDYAEKHDMEGIMVNRDVPYKRKRHNGILKVKKFYTMDLRVIGFEAGRFGSKFENTLGCLVVDFKGNPVGVSGFTDEMRDKIWNNQEDYLGKLVCVKYKEITKDKDTGVESLQFPVFECFRTDKNDVSYE